LEVYNESDWKILSTSCSCVVLAAAPQTPIEALKTALEESPPETKDERCKGISCF
nr:hypothetical protein [Tanacetum cinerariifolium]